MRDRLDLTAAAGAGLLIGAGVGAGIMYLFDPNRGRARRAELEGRAKRICHETERTIGKLAKDVENRMEGVAAEARQMLDGAPVEPEKLTARVRAKLGRLVRKPHDISVEAVDGRVLLSGEVDASEAGHLLAGVIAIPGVKDVENKLVLRHLDTDNVTKTAGAIAGVAGGLLTFAGIRALKNAG